MRRATIVVTLALAATAGVVALVSAQGAPKESPAWAYGVPPASAGAPGPRAGGAPGQAAAGGQRGAPDTSLNHIPDSTQEFTLAHIRDFSDVADWFPGDHPPPPDVVLKGRAPAVRGCGMCHMPNGKGRPEN